MSSLDELRDKYTPYVVATASLRSRIDLEPLGFPITKSAWFDPTRRASAPMLDLLQALDAVTFGPEGMPMPRWAFYDCAEIPGAIVGFARPRSELAPEWLTDMDVPLEYDGLVPLSMYMAIPCLSSDHWLGYSICSLLEVTRVGDADQLNALTTAVALTMLRARIVTSNTQWDSTRLPVHARFAPLDVLAGWVPTHSRPGTCVYRFEADPVRLERAIAGPMPAPADADWVEASDHAGLHALQARLESGTTLSIVGSPERDLAGQRVPVRWGD